MKSGAYPRAWPFLSPTSARRRRTPWVTRSFALLMLVVVGAGVVVVVASAGSRPTGHRAPAAAVASRPPVSSTHPQALPAATLASGDQAIDHALSYTPFVRAGTPRHLMIALTFDDGPSPYTPQIVNVLVRMHVPATFFVVGQQLRYFAAGLRDEIKHGFVIGDHTENHAPLSVLGEPLQYFQIHEAAVRISRLGAPFPRLFRPPYGYYDAETFAILRRLNMLMVMWSVDPRDWLRPGVRTIVERVLQGARPGTIVELHDGGGNRSETVAALPAIITALRRRHYEFVTVPELLAADPPPRGQALPHLSE